MKCPRCGSEMSLDMHRKIPQMMCYECGYIEGRTFDTNFDTNMNSNFAHLKMLNFNETVAFLTRGLNVDEEKLSSWLEEEFEKE